MANCVSIVKVDKYEVYKKIQTLDAKQDHQEIAFLTGSFEFPWDTQRALELALLRTFAVPNSSKLMVKTEEFTKRTQKRYDDTTIIISSIGFYGYDSPEGRAAIRQMNQIHARYSIPNDEFLYVLTTFVFEPIRWNAKYGWRKLSEKEKQANYYFWCEVGKRMNIKNIPETYEKLELFNRAYEQEHFAYHDNNRILAEATRDLFLSWVLPKKLWPLGAEFVYILMDEPMRNAFGFPKPKVWALVLVESALWLRKRALRFFPPRKKAFVLPQPRTYPNGYEIQQVGPAKT